MKSGLLLLVLLLAALQPKLALAGVVKVPEDRQTIQLGIEEAQNGDTVSVWGDGAPPFTYYENVFCRYKDLFIVNRSFLPGETPEYDSSWDHVVIDGTWRGPVVYLHAYTAVLKGFTIQNGFHYYRGGGVCCLAGTVVKNHIHHNISQSGGGGIGTYPQGHWAYIYDNLIEDNETQWYGGGILATQTEAWEPLIDIQRNVIRRNKSMGRLGGGVFLHISTPNGMPPPSISPALFLDNVVVDNYAVGNTQDDPYGGGIFVQHTSLLIGYPIIARRNVITNNDPDGVCIAGGHYPETDFGTPWDPGLNVIMNNVTRDLVTSDAVAAVGNYWGYLDTPTILERIQRPVDGDVRYDPVAASSRWFDVDLEPESYCETDVLVTGDCRARLPSQPARSSSSGSIPTRRSQAATPAGRTSYSRAAACRRSARQRTPLSSRPGPTRGRPRGRTTGMGSGLEP
jgi:hypothetical protein